METRWYSATAWFCMKIPWAAWVAVSMIYTVLHLQQPSSHTAINQYSNIVDFVAKPSISYSLMAFVLFFLGLYLFEKWMLVATFGLFALGMLLYTLEENSGYRGENGITTLAFFVQGIAYLIAIRNPIGVATNRVRFTVQVIAATYVLAGISKLHASGLGWFTTDASYFSLQVMRRFYCSYVSDGDNNHIQQGLRIANWLLQHPIITKCLLASGLVLELGAVVLIINRKVAFVYAWLLLAFHIGIYWVLGIFYPSQIFPLVIFFINPLYWLCLLVKKLMPAVSLPFNKDTAV